MQLEIQKSILRLLIHRQIRDCQMKRFGSPYGGYQIATGSLRQGCKVLSFGIGEDNSFDCAMMDEYHAGVAGFDPTPKAIAWVESHVKTGLFRFYSYGIAEKDGTETFYLPNNPTHVSGSLISNETADHRKIKVPMKCIGTILKELQISGVSVIKMDIEGSEFKVIPTILESGLSFHQLCAEVHWRFFQNGWLRFLLLVRQMNRKNYYIADYTDDFEVVTFVKGYRKK